jgi:mono/diheme cytochrome c family protein
VRLALLGVLLAVGLLASACGGSSPAKDRRAAVNAYFDQVDRAEASVVASQGQIDDTYRHFSVARITPSELRQLAFAETTTADALRRVKLITPPADARRMHADIIRLATLQHQVAQELHETATYLPRFSAALAGIPGAGRTLGEGISTATSTPLKPAVSPSSGGGAALWAQSGCGDCHSLGVAGAVGTAGPNLDQLHPTAAEIAAQMRSGGPGMPSFAHKLTSGQISELAGWVAASETPPKTTREILNDFGAAFAHYGTQLQQTLDALDRIDPPPVLRPTYLAEKRLLAHSVRLCAAIAAQLAKQNVTGANASIKELFTVVATGVSAAKDRNAAAAAVRAYNAQLLEISKLSSKISTERGTLISRVG